MLVLRVCKFRRLFGLFAVCLFVFAVQINAQKRRVLPARKAQTAKRGVFVPLAAVVIDERLAVLRFEPGLNGIPLQRMRHGREVTITNEREIDGIKFFQVQLPPEKSGWVQAEAVASNFKKGDDERFARLINASDGFDKIERAAVFLENFQNSIFRPAILLLFGDLLEESAMRLTRDATRRLDNAEMQANGAPVHSYFLSYAGLDRFRKIGVNFVFDAAQKQFHYDGAAWREIAQKYPHSQESKEAAKRLQSPTAAAR